MGLKYDDRDLTKINAIDISRYEIIVLDEILLHGTFKLVRVK